MLRHQLSAFFSAGIAFLSTLNTMIHVVHFTFMRTGFTNISTRATQQRGMCSSNRQKRRRRSTNRRAFTVQFDTLNHHFHIIFLQTGSCTLFTHDGAGNASVNTYLKTFVVHKFGGFVKV
jgi:hypothetical protein